MIIRRAAQDEASIVWNIRNLAISAQCRNDYSGDVIETWIRGDPPTNFASELAESTWVAEIDNEIVGFGKIYLDSGVVESMFVHPDRMLLGIGTKIMEHLEKIAVDFGLAELTLDSSLNAVQFYHRCGFKVK